MKRNPLLLFFPILLFSCSQPATFQSCLSQFPTLNVWEDRISDFKEASTDNPLEQEEADFLLEQLSLEKGQTLIPFAYIATKDGKSFKILLFEIKDKSTILATYDTTGILIDHSSLPSNAELNFYYRSYSSPELNFDFYYEKPRFHEDYKEEIPAIYTITSKINPEGEIKASEANFNTEKSILLLPNNNEYSGTFTYKRPRVEIKLVLRDGKEENAYAWLLNVKTYKGCTHTFTNYRSKKLDTGNSLNLEDSKQLSVKIIDKNVIMLNNKGVIKNCKDDWPFTIKLRREGTWRYTENQDGSYIYIEDSLGTGATEEDAKQILEVFEQTRPR